MYGRKFWEVLVVDDEPDVHAVTSLVLDSIDIAGVPLLVRTAKSAAEAKTLLASTGWKRASGEHVSELAVALIDVVMESDTAGLELCRHIREDLKNTATQLVVRTGQAGKAPERSVIDRYDISTYITKVEATEERLYTIVKTGIRQFQLLRVAQGTRALTNATIAAFAEVDRKEQGLLERLPTFLSWPTLNPDGKRVESIDGNVAVFVDSHVSGAGEFTDHKAATQLRDALRAKPATMTFLNGEECRQYGNDVLLTLPEGKRKIEMIGRVTMNPMPDFVASAYLGWLTSLRHLLSIAV